MYPIVFVCLLATSLLLAQDSEPSNSQPANISGAWQLSWQSRGGSQRATIQIQQDGPKLSGTFQGPRASSSLTGSVDGNNVSFSVQMQGRRSVKLAFTGTIHGDKMSGTLQPQGGGQGNHPWSAVRQQDKSGRHGQPEQHQDENDEYGL
jgi:hypothetical protein